MIGIVGYWNNGIMGEPLALFPVFQDSIIPGFHPSSHSGMFIVCL